MVSGNLLEKPVLSYDPLCDRGDRAHVERLGDEVPRSFPHGVHRVFHRGVAGNHDHRKQGPEFLYLPHEVNTGHPRHCEVRKDHVVVPLRKLLYPFISARDAFRRVPARTRKNVRKNVSHDGIIVHDEYASAFHFNAGPAFSLPSAPPPVREPQAPRAFRAAQASLSWPLRERPHKA